jgi:hypothetical protein
MKKPSSDERADASRLVTVSGHIAFTGEPPCPGGAGWRGRQPKLSMRVAILAVEGKEHKVFFKNTCSGVCIDNDRDFKWSIGGRTLKSGQDGSPSSTKSHNRDHEGSDRDESLR